MDECRRDEQGQVLWGLLVMLGLMTELALGSLQLAAHEGIAVNLLEQRVQQEQRLRAIAGQLARMPVPARAQAASALWHPLSAGIRLGCCRATREPLISTSASCPASGQSLLAARHASGTWQWRLQRIADDPALSPEGTDTRAFSTLQAQRWQLEVVVAGPAGIPAKGLWQHYLQVSP